MKIYTKLFLKSQKVLFPTEIKRNDFKRRNKPMTSRK